MLIRTPVAENGTRCSTCALSQICLPVGIAAEDAAKMDALVSERVRIPRGKLLYRQGDPLTTVYGVRFGTLKTVLTLQDGRSQITGFHLPGEIVGLDGLGKMAHVSDAIALEDSEACVLRFDELQELARELPSLQIQIMRLMSNEISRDHDMLVMLGAMRAEERLAAFLLNLSQRMSTRGYSATEFLLRMSREEIGSYLGLKLETVSRLFSRFAESGFIQVKQRQVKLVDMDALRQLVGSRC